MKPHDDDLVRTKVIREETGITAAGLDKHIKSKGITKYRNSDNQVCILKTDYAIIKKAMELNGRLKKLHEKDIEDKELEQSYKAIKEEKEELSKQIDILNINLHNAEDKINGLVNDKQMLQGQLATATDNLAITQKLLSQEQELHLKEKQLREQLEDKLRTNKLLLENIDNEKHDLEQKIQAAENKAKDIESKFNKLLDEKKEAELKYNESLIEKDNELKKIENDRAAAEIAITKVSEYENMNFMRRIKFAITGK